MNDAIKLAIEKGGYKTSSHTKQQVKFGWGLGKNALAVIVQDPLFWQALGKALGWKLKVLVIWDWDTTWTAPITEMESWRWYAHQYFDLVLTGGDTEKFWSDILN